MSSSSHSCDSEDLPASLSDVLLLDHMHVQARICELLDILSLLLWLQHTERLAVVHMYSNDVCMCLASTTLI